MNKEIQKSEKIVKKRTETQETRESQNNDLEEETTLIIFSLEGSIGLTNDGSMDYRLQGYNADGTKIQLVESFASPLSSDSSQSEENLIFFNNLISENTRKGDETEVIFLELTSQLEPEIGVGKEELDEKLKSKIRLVLRFGGKVPVEVMRKWVFGDLGKISAVNEEILEGVFAKFCY